MSPNNVNTDAPFLSHSEMDQFDEKMATIMQSSISKMFRQLIEPVDSGKHDIDTVKTPLNKQPPPLKLHDFGGSDFVRLAEKSRRNRSSSSSRSLEANTHFSHDQPTLSTPLNKTIKSSSKQNTLKDDNGSMDTKKLSFLVEKPSRHDQSLLSKDWKCTQEYVYRTDGSEETVYQKYKDGVATETLHHVLYPDGTIKDIKKPTMIPSSSSITSSLSSMNDSTSQMNGPFKRLWHLVFD